MAAHLAYPLILLNLQNAKMDVKDLNHKMPMQFLTAQPMRVVDLIYVYCASFGRHWMYWSPLLAAGSSLTRVGAIFFLTLSDICVGACVFYNDILF